MNIRIQVSLYQMNEVRQSGLLRYQVVLRWRYRITGSTATATAALELAYRYGRWAIPWLC